jgi:uncharacterized protein (TIGR02246 family)
VKRRGKKIAAHESGKPVKSANRENYMDDLRSGQLVKTPPDEGEVRALYTRLLAAWNDRDPSAFAGLFTEDGSTIGFDGSILNGRGEIESSLAQIFAHHSTARYVAKIRSLQFLTADAALVRAISGMIPRGTNELNPAVNAHQTLIAGRQADQGWKIILFQNTPAQFHGRPDLVQQMTEELQGLV